MKNDRKKQDVKRGFTLVELLVVIAIIALLLSILLPSLNKARELARSVVSVSNTKQIGLAFQMYAGDSKDCLPYYADWTDQSNFEKRWYGSLMPYITKFTKKGQNVPVFICPSRTAKVTNNKFDPSVQKIDYGVSYVGSGGLFSYKNFPNTSNLQSERISRIRNAGNVFIMMDSQPQQIDGVWYSLDVVYAPYSPTYPNGTPSWTFDIDYDNDGIFDSSSAGLSPRYPYPPYLPFNCSAHRHNKGLSVTFADGHSANVKTKEWVQKQHWMW